MFCTDISCASIEQFGDPPVVLTTRIDRCRRRIWLPDFFRKPVSADRQRPQESCFFCVGSSSIKMYVQLYIYTFYQIFR